jgi:hypothetical protein
METIMDLGTAPMATQAQPHPTRLTRPSGNGKPLTRVTLPPGPAVPHFIEHQNPDRHSTFELGSFESYPGQVGLGNLELAERKSLQKRKPGRPKGTTKKGATSDNKGNSKSRSRTGPAEASSNRDSSLSGPQGNRNGSNSSSTSNGPHASTSAAGDTAPHTSTSQEDCGVAKSGKNTVRRPRKDEMSTGSQLRRRSITPPPTEYVCNSSYAANRPLNPDSPRLLGLDLAPDQDEVLTSRPRMKPPGKSRKPMAGKKVGRPKTNRDPAVMLKELIEKQQENEREKRRKNQLEHQDQGDHPACFFHQSREGDPRCYPPSMTHSSGDGSTSSPTTPGNRFTNPYPGPYQLTQLPPAANVELSLGDTHYEYGYGTEAQSHCRPDGGEWYPPVSQEETSPHEFCARVQGLVPQNAAAYSQLDQQGSLSEENLYTHPPLSHPFTSHSQHQGDIDSKAATHGLGLHNHHHGLIPHHGHVHHEDPPSYHSQEDPSTASTPAQDWPPPDSKLKLAASVIGALIDLFPISPALNDALLPELLKHVSLIVDPTDGL